MARTSTVRLLSPEEIAVQAGQQVPFLHWPERTLVFAEREMRLRQRAAGHPMHDFLGFMAALAHSQHEALQRDAAVPLPDAQALDKAARLGVPPVAATQWPRDRAWLSGFHAIVATLLPRIQGSPAQTAVLPLQSAEPAWLEQQADALLAQTMHGLDLTAAPVIAAALQTYWTHLILATRDARGADRLPPFGRVNDASRCPCCASRPSASVVRIGAESAGYRYLHCALCSMQWHKVRITCSRCGQTQGIHYQSLRALDEAGGDGRDELQAKPAVEAETCDACGHYLKIVHMDRDPGIEPIADDLASVPLDLLVAEAGFRRQGVNFMLLYGESEAETAAAMDDDGLPAKTLDAGRGIDHG